VNLVPVDGTGLIDPARLRRAISADTVLVSIAHASAEIGTVQPLRELCLVAHRAGVPLHTDATATAGSLSLPADSEGPDLITLSPHLFHGPQGVGALRVRRGVRLAPLIEGGGQEAGLRAGTEPLAAIVGFGAAATLVCREGARRARSAAALAEHMHRWIDTHLDGVVWTGHPVHRVPGLLTLCVRGVEAEAVLKGLDAEGIEAASGSACTTEVRKASHVLQAIGVDPVTARGALTFAFGELNVPGDADTSAQTLESVVRRLRALSPIDAR
jgi:cysteine desulfurase